MNPLEAFPFKNMRTIVDLVEEGEVDVSAIRSATGMCSFDSTEVLDMLTYLTSFGRVEAEEGGWLLQKTEEEAAYERFRKSFLEAAVAILSKLTEKAKSVEQLSKETGLKLETVEVYLPFLADITRLGVISRCSNEYPLTWCQKSE
ncbi:MAG: hypothetical protein ACFE9D_03400 [Promethearchaeota archaeon]